MKYKETLNWILDKLDENGGTSYGDDEKYKVNIDFVHSLGQKCDCVGWSKLDLAAPFAEDVIAKTEEFCRANGWGARGWYERKFTETGSGWFELNIPDVNDYEYIDHGDDTIFAIRGYKSKGVHMMKKWHERGIVVSTRAKEALIRGGIAEESNFYPVPDTGKYAAEEYYFFFPKECFAHAAFCHFEFDDAKWQKDNVPDKDNIARMQALGGKLPRLAEVFYNLHVDAREIYPISELPKSGFAYVNAPTGYVNFPIVVSEKMAKILLDAKVISKKMLAPVALYDEIPAGYEEKTGEPFEAFAPDIVERLYKERDALRKKKRPVRKPTEKEALKFLRKAKSERKEDFGKKMKKELCEVLAGCEYAPLAPYYAVANGGALCDEYEFLAYDKAIEANADFFRELEKEELLEEKPRGALFAKCPDGDAVLLLEDGTVVRFNHEVPEVWEKWESLAEFFEDNTKAEG
ncbi:MAG: hypothetical protein IJX27_04090 [Clostridia bacterium]|nr:hypothetical protein [Clostridia bacterium]